MSCRRPTQRALLADGAAGVLSPAGHDGHVQVDPSGQGTDKYPSHEQTEVEDIPPGLGLPPLEGEVKQGGEDEG